MKFTYLLINFFSIIIPFIFSFYPKLRFDRKWKAFFPAMVIMAIIFLVWDEYFTQWGVWGFNPIHLTGIYIGSLPLEEVLFFICIPYACVFTYHCLTNFYEFNWPSGIERVFTIFLILVLIVAGIVFSDRLYTTSTFISLSIFLFVLRFLLKVKWLNKFYTVWAVLMIPFFIVNGMLTGTGVEQEVVWYNNSENLGIRMISIPVEDTFYGMELILGNIALYNYFQNKLGI